MKEVRIEDVRRILADVYNKSGRESRLDPEGIRNDDLLFDYEGTGAENLEFDSLDALEVAACLEDEYDIALPSEVDPIRISTPARIVEFMSELIGTIA